MQQQISSDKLTLQSAVALLNQKDAAPSYLNIRLSAPINQVDTDAFQRALSRNTSVKRISFCADQPDTPVAKPFLDAVVEVLHKNVHITDLTFKHGVIPDSSYDQIEQQLQMNKLYATERKKIIEPRSKLVNFNMSYIEKSFEKKIEQLEKELKSVVEQTGGPIKLSLVIGDLTVANINLLVELRKKYPIITELSLNAAFKMFEDPEQICSAVSNLAAGLTSLDFKMAILPNYVEGEKEFNRKTWERCINTLTLCSELQVLTLNLNINVAIATKIANCLQDNKNLRSLSITAIDDATLTVLSDGLRANTTLVSLKLQASINCTKGLANLCIALQNHPVLESLEIDYKNKDIRILTGITSLLTHTTSLKMLHLSLSTRLSEEHFILLCAALESNASVYSFSVRPREFTVNCAKALNQLLTRNHTLQELELCSFGNRPPIPCASAAIKELFSNIPLNSRIRVFRLIGEKIDENLDENECIEIFSSLYLFLKENKRLVELVCSFGEDNVLSLETKTRLAEEGKVYVESNKANKLEELTLPSLDLYNFNALRLPNPNRTKRLIQERYAVLTAIEKLLIHLSPDEEETTLLEKQAVQVFETVINLYYLTSDHKSLVNDNYNKDPHLQALILRVHLALAQHYLQCGKLCEAYEKFNVAIEIPEASAYLVNMLFPDQYYILFHLSKTERLQYLLLLLINTDLQSDTAISLTKKILHTLQTGKDEIYNGSFMDLIGADRPLPYAVLVKIANSIVTRYADSKEVSAVKENSVLLDQLQEVLNDEIVSEIERFNLLRTHPYVKVELQNRYGTIKVVCFEGLIANKGYKTSFNFSLEWNNVYQVYLQAKQLVRGGKINHTAAQDFVELDAIKEKFKECYDMLYLTQLTRSSARYKKEFRKRLEELSASVPVISAFLGTLFLELNYFDHARKYFIQAAKQGEFSEIEVLTKRAESGDHWAINVLSDPSVTSRHSQMWPFLGMCYKRLGRTQLALSCYRQTVPMTDEVLVAMGDCYIETDEIDNAIDCYRQAHPSNNDDACNALKRIEENYHDSNLTRLLASIYREKFHLSSNDTNILMLALRYNIKAAAAENIEAKNFLNAIESDSLITQRIYAEAQELEENTQDIEFVKQLYAIAQKSHPVAKLDLFCLTQPPVISIKEKILNDHPKSYCESLVAYFDSFTEANTFIQSDNSAVSKAISQHLKKNPDLQPREILLWLREKAIGNGQVVNGEFARMFCCAIVKLKEWSDIGTKQLPLITLSPLESRISPFGFR